MDKNIKNFSIFLPVRNGGEHLALCIESILAQTYQGFDLIVLENQSTDGTAEWLQTLEKKESRVKVIPVDCSLSIEDNWKRILTVPKNKFMTIIGHDDLLNADFLEEINSLIKKEPEANLYLTHFKLIDSKGKLIRYCKPIPEYETAAEFLAARMATIRDSFGTGYVMNAEHYDRLGGIRSFIDLLFADDALWLELMGQSFKVTSPRVCFSYRLHAGSVSGRPNSKALFNSLKLYLGLLSQLAKKNCEFDRVLKYYVPEFVSIQSQHRYYDLLREAPWGYGINEQELIELELLLNEFAPDTVLDKTHMSIGRRLRRFLIRGLGYK